MDRDFLLIRKMKRGDEAAMEAFVYQYYPLILRYCQYHIPDAGYAEDMVQETFEHFFSALAGYEHHGKALNYLYTIAGNLCRDFYRQKKELVISDFAESEENTQYGICPGGNGMLPDETDVTNDRLDMEQALHSLPEELREVVILYYFQELKQKEIAKILGIGLPLVKYRLKRAKEMLTAYFIEEKQE